MDNDNASMLTNAAALLERYRAEERVLELDLHVMQTRLDMIRDVVSSLSGKPRTRRGRPPRLVEQAEEAPAAELLPVA